MSTHKLTIVGATAALLAAGLVQIAGRDRAAADAALERAWHAWDKGDYVAALATYQDLLAGPDAASVLEPIALQTGELFRTSELTVNGANPAFSPDSRHFAFETGPGVSAGTATSIGRRTHVRAIGAADKDATILDGGDASFCPDGKTVAFLRVAASPEIVAAQDAVAAAATAQERTPRQQALTRLIARTGRIVVRDLGTGRDQELNTGDLLKTGMTCGADGAVLFAGAAESDTAATQIYVARAGAAPQALTKGEGFKVPSKIDAAGRTLLYLGPRQGPFRIGGPGGRGGAAAPATATADPTATGETPAEGTGAGGGGGRGANATTAFGIVTLGGTATPMTGVAPALSRDGRYVAWIARPGAATAAGEQRLLVAPSDALGSPTELRKGADRLEAPSLAPDGSRVAFQAMAREDWELFVVGRDGKGETRVTREIQHDLLPQFLDPDRLLGMIGEARHRRSYLYEAAKTDDGAAPVFRRSRLFHNNTVRTIAPEYVWVPSPDGTRLLIVAERDGDTVSAERGVYLMDLTSRVSLAELKTRIAENLKAELALRAEGKRLFAPIAADVAKVTAAASAARVFAHEKALYDFDSKHITRPGNKLASEYLFGAYTSSNRGRRCPAPAPAPSSV